MSSFNEIAVLSLPAIVNQPPVGGETLSWNGTTVYYQWTVILNIEQQQTSSPTTRAPLEYDGMDVNVGMWIADVNAGQAWQIVSITAKNSSVVTCIVQDIFRYNTYRDPSQQGFGDPQTSNYVVFQLAENGIPVIDPIPLAANPLFYSQLVSRFAYISNQDDFTLSQPGDATITFNYGDIVAIHEPSQTFVLADSADPHSVIGRVTAVDDTGTIFTINPLGKIVDTFNSLPGDVGSLLYTDPSNPGQLTDVEGGTEVYIQIRSATQSTASSSDIASSTVPVTTPGYQFTINNVVATIGGTGRASDIVNAINSTTSTSGVSAVLAGSGGPYNIVSTAVDARAINFVDTAGSVTTDVGLISVENGVKAAAMSIPATTASPPTGLLNSYGFVFVQPTVSASTTWTIVHNANTLNVSTQIYNDPINTGSAIFPDEITVVDVNTVQVTFQAAQAGKAFLTVFK